MKDPLQKWCSNSSQNLILLSIVHKKNPPLYWRKSGVPQMVSYTVTVKGEPGRVMDLASFEYISLLFSKSLWHHILFNFTALLVTHIENSSVQMFKLQMIISGHILISNCIHFGHAPELTFQDIVL